jgi:hypothetical protein
MVGFIVIGWSVARVLPADIRSREKIAQRTPHLDRHPHLMTVPIAAGVEMAPLTPGCQIARVVVAGIGIFMAAGQDDAAELRSAYFDHVGP